MKLIFGGVRDPSGPASIRPVWLATLITLAFESGLGVWHSDNDHPVVQERQMNAGNCGFLSAC